MDRIEIPLSKSKIILLLAGAIFFVGAGVLFILMPQTFISPIFKSILTIKLTGLAAILFFGAVGIYGFRKLFDKAVGLVIDDDGITDNTNAASAGLIMWSDITGIGTEQVMSSKILLLHTSDPDKYLNRTKGLKRKLLQGNMKMYGTPLAITSSTVQYNFDELEKIIGERLIRQQEKFLAHNP